MNEEEAGAMKGEVSLWRLSAVVLAGSMALLSACNLPSSVEQSAPTANPTWTATAEPTESPMPSETPSPTIVGTYHCSGHEGGTLASAAVVTFYPDGTYLDGPTPILSRQERRGRWRLRKPEGILEFPGDSLFAGGEYDSERRHILIRLREGKTMVHAEEGTLSCNPAPSLAPED